MRFAKGKSRPVGVTIFLLFLLAEIGSADPALALPGDSTLIAPGPEYEAGWLHELFFGGNYRELWTTPIAVPVLNLQNFAGGLTPQRKGGGAQTISLRFKSADGRRYNFRSVNKDPTKSLPPLLRETLADEIVQDAISVHHPGAALVLPPLMSAIGLLAAEAQLFVMPDDPALGEFRAEFAGLLGTLELHPDEGPDDTPGFAGSRKIVGTDKLHERMMKSARNRVAARNYLAARLFDIFIGDRDRHFKQWRWASFEQGSQRLWYPIPEDRDHAFVRSEGLLPWFARWFAPQLVGFDADYPPAFNLTWSGRHLDRWLLSELDWPSWDSVATALQHHLSDTLIERATRLMPAAMAEINADELAQALKLRRNDLGRMAFDFYYQLAERVDIHATNENDRAFVTRLDDEHSEVRLYSDDDDEPYFFRRFVHEDTEELRIYLHGGDDRAVIRGDVDEGITIRIIGGEGNDSLEDSTRSGAGAAVFYDASGDNAFSEGACTRVERDPYEAPPHLRELYGTDGGNATEMRDWGSFWRPVFASSVNPDFGLIMGGGIEVWRYQFRHKPFLQWGRYEAAVASEAGAYKFQFSGRRHFENSKLDMSGSVSYSTMEFIRFYGFGNETAKSRPDDYYKVRQTSFAVESTFGYRMSNVASLGLELLQAWNSHNRKDNSILRDSLYYGGENFREFSVSAIVDIDTRNRTIAADSGIHGRLQAGLSSREFQSRSEFGIVKAHLSVYQHFAELPGEPTIALRLGGVHTWGRTPLFRAAFIGGPDNLRGLDENRFAGESAFFANAELRLSLGNFFVLLPGEYGVFGLSDSGRVFLEAENSGKWHRSIGGGFWFAWLDRANTISLAFAQSNEGSGLYAGLGFMF